MGRELRTKFFNDRTSLFEFPKGSTMDPYFRSGILSDCLQFLPGHAPAIEEFPCFLVEGPGQNNTQFIEKQGNNVQYGLHTVQKYDPAL